VAFRIADNYIYTAQTMATPHSTECARIEGDYTENASLEDMNVLTDVPEDTLGIVRQIESSGKDVVDALFAVLREWPSTVRKRRLSAAKKVRIYDEKTVLCMTRVHRTSVIYHSHYVVTIRVITQFGITVTTLYTQITAVEISTQCLRV